MNSDHFLSSGPVIGTARLRGRAVLAPMSGISDVAFRRIAARFGAGMAVTEMVASHAYVENAAESRLRAEGAGIRPHVVQLVGRDPHSMGEGARLAEASGADIVDINFGCPAKRVTGAICGSALMREAGLALRILDAVVAAVTVPVTVKMRLGWDAASLTAADLSREAAARGVSAITVHGRTRQQFYTGAADWRAIRETVAAVPVPVIANGDVVDFGSARECLVQSGAAAVMIGRAALGQPWIVGQIGAALAGLPFQSPTRAERAASVAEHYRELIGLYGPQMGVRHARKHLAAYADRAAEAGFGLDDGERMELVTTTDPARVVRLLLRLYDAPRRLAA